MSPLSQGSLAAGLQVFLTVSYNAVFTEFKLKQVAIVCREYKTKTAAMRLGCWKLTWEKKHLSIISAKVNWLFSQQANLLMITLVLFL